MHPFVHYQVVPLRETLGAIGAGVGFDTGMDAVVYAPFVNLRKPLPAYIAEVPLFVDLFLSVHFDVLLQSCAPCKTLEADIALILAEYAVNRHTMVTYLVRGEIARKCEILIAYDTAERSLPLVHVTVLLEQDTVIKTFPAQFAVVNKFAQMECVDVYHNGRPPHRCVLTKRATEPFGLIVIVQMARVLVRFHERLLANRTGILLFVLPCVLLYLVFVNRLNIARKTAVNSPFVIITVIVLDVVLVSPMTLAMLAQFPGRIEAFAAFRAIPNALLSALFLG